MRPRYVILDEKHGIVVDGSEEPSQAMFDLAVKYKRVHSCEVAIYERAGDITDQHVAAQVEAEVREAAKLAPKTVDLQLVPVNELDLQPATNPATDEK